MALFVSASLVLRTAMLVQSWRFVTGGAGDLARIYGVGLFFDVVSAFVAMLPVALYLMLAPNRLFQSRLNRYLATGLYFAATFALLFDVAAEWLFWDEFNTRFNFIAIDYLVYTQEVVANAWQSYPITWIILSLLAATAILVFLTRKAFTASFAHATTFTRRLAGGAAFIVVPAVTLLWVENAMSNVSKNPYVNELAKNGGFSLVSAFWENEIDYSQFYVMNNDAAMFRRLRELLANPRTPFVSDDPFDIRREVKSDQPPLRANVVILTIESLSAEYLTEFGGKDGLTPNLDQLCRESLLFRRLYATGTRTVRGLEAIMLSLPPTPGSSVVRRPHNEGMFSLAGVLADNGYDNKFVYGGHGYFDNMNYFFSTNGCRPIDRTDMAKEEVTFENAWGVCDGDLFARVIKEGDASFATGKPFFSFVMSTSNHRPFTYPDRIDIPSGRRHGAVKYTDYAIGEFIRQARTRPWFDNTIFVIIADHCAGSAGKTEIPVDKYHIPLLIYAPKLVPAGEVKQVCSQIDLAPTLLGLMNISYTSRFFGVDVMRDKAGRALMGTYQKLALLEDSELTVLSPKRQHSQYAVDTNDDESLLPQEAPQRLIDTVSYYQTASYLIKNQMLKK